MSSSTHDMGYVISITQPDPDGAGSLTAHVTTYRYDYLNRRDKITDANLGETSFTFDVGNQLM